MRYVVGIGAGWRMDDADLAGLWVMSVLCSTMDMARISQNCSLTDGYERYLKLLYPHSIFSHRMDHPSVLSFLPHL